MRQGQRWRVDVTLLRSGMWKVEALAGLQTVCVCSTLDLRPAGSETIRASQPCNEKLSILLHGPLGPATVSLI
jgi:hypothetical protein